jgi:hypothetical protein
MIVCSKILCWLNREEIVLQDGGIVLQNEHRGTGVIKVFKEKNHARFKSSEYLNLLSKTLSA